MTDRTDGLRFARMPGGEIILALPDEVATRALGARLAQALQPGLTVYLSGELGSGKTTLVRGLLHALGHPGRVKSPTFSLLEVYRVSSLELYHFDFYRFERAQEWHDAGFRDLFDGSGVCLVEWPERAASLLPAPDLAITLAYAGASRVATLSSGTERGRQCLDRTTQ